jgi:hypothetical protein
MRVPMWSTGTDYPVVVSKDGNASGAKGVDYPAGFEEQPLNGRNLWRKQSRLKFPNGQFGKRGNV